MRPTVLSALHRRMQTRCPIAVSRKPPARSFIRDEIQLQDVTAAAGAEHGNMLLKIVSLDDIEGSRSQLLWRFAVNDNSSMCAAEPAAQCQPQAAK